MKKSKKKILVMTSAYKRRQDDEQFNEYFVVELTKKTFREIRHIGSCPFLAFSKG